MNWTQRISSKPLAQNPFIDDETDFKRLERKPATLNAGQCAEKFLDLMQTGGKGTFNDPRFGNIDRKRMMELLVPYAHTYYALVEHKYHALPPVDRSFSGITTSHPDAELYAISLKATARLFFFQLTRQSGFEFHFLLDEETRNRMKDKGEIPGLHDWSRKIEEKDLLKMKPYPATEFFGSMMRNITDIGLSNYSVDVKTGADIFDELVKNPNTKTTFLAPSRVRLREESPSAQGHVPGR